MNILVDMDGVLCHWDAAYDSALDTYGEAAALIPRSHDRLAFNLNEGRTWAERKIIEQIMVMPGFYAELEPIEGGIEAIKEMDAEGHDVRIVTSPWASNPTCASDKLNWVRRHIGQSWSARTILTNDKTLVRGHILIDDKPVIAGVVAPTWEHVVFDQPHNRYQLQRRRINNWSEWRTILA